MSDNLSPVVSLFATEGTVTSIRPLGNGLIKKWIAPLIIALTVCTAEAQHRNDALDDILQHAPMASVIALKACGVNSQSSWQEMTFTAVSSYAVAAAVTYSGKQLVSERRPDGSDRRAFPSGHATFAFAGATALHHEYGHLSPWVSVGGYGLATLVAVDRVRRDRHYIHDVCAGAAVGVLSTELSYFLKRKLFKSIPLDLTFTGNELSLQVQL